MFTTATATSPRLAQLQRRYARVLCIQAFHPHGFNQGRLGLKDKTLIERCDDTLRHLRSLMSDIWELRDVQHAYMQDRIATLAQHITRVRRFAAVISHEWPMFGNERQIWSKLDVASHLIELALDQARSGKCEEEDEEDMGDPRVDISWADLPASAA